MPVSQSTISQHLKELKLQKQSTIAINKTELFF